MRLRFAAAAAASFLVAGLITGSMALSGCKTVTTTPPGSFTPIQTVTLDTNVTITLINAGVPPLVNLACQKDRNAGAYFQQASVALKAVATGGQFDPSTVSNSLAVISIRELRSATAVQAEEAGLALYRTFFGQVVAAKLNQTAWLPPILNALADALAAGVPAPGTQ